jgi:xylulokinase
MQYILSIDTGSSSAKIGLYNETGAIVDLVRIPTKVRSSERTIAHREYDPEIWWQASVDGIQQLLAQSSVQPREISAIGLTGQIGTHIIIDGNGNSLFPAMSWQDGRAQHEAQIVQERYPDSLLDSVLGMHLPPGTAWPIPRMLWLKQHHPELFKRPFTLMQTKDYVAYRLTGMAKTDVLSLRGLVHPKSRRIDAIVSNDILGIPDMIDRIPAFGDATESIGGIHKEAAYATGLLEGTPVIAGCGDFHAALVGTGIIDGSYGFNITGTSDHIGRLIPEDSKGIGDSRLGRYPSVVPGWDIFYGATSSGGGAVQWFLEQIADKPENQSIADYVESMLSQAPNSSGILFLPYLNGERAPIWDAMAKGSFVGLGAAHGKPQLFRALLEGVVCSLNDCLSIIHDATGEQVPLRISGAAGGDRCWNQMKANIFGVPVSSMRCLESTSLGAAIITAIGIGWYDSYQNGIDAMVATEENFQPDASTRNYYSALFTTFRETYQALKPVFRNLSHIRNEV